MFFRTARAAFRAGQGPFAAMLALGGGVSAGCHVTNDVITNDAEYINGIKIYGVGIKQDPIPGEKRGKGIQHLNSDYFMYELGTFIEHNYEAIYTMMKYAREMSEEHPGYDFRYYVNCSNALLMKALNQGLRTQDAYDYFMMASWALMAAADVDTFTAYYDSERVKYTDEQREKMRQDFYLSYMSPDVPFVSDTNDREIERTLGKYSINSCRLDLIPSVAMERLGLHNELCALKWKDPTVWQREGFVLSARVDSLKRHFESIHAKDTSEDHIAHAIWGFMAIWHVLMLFPSMNNLTDFEEIREKGQPGTRSFIDVQRELHMEKEGLVRTNRELALQSFQAGMHAASKHTEAE